MAQVAVPVTWFPLNNFRCPINGCKRNTISSSWTCGSSDRLQLYINDKGYVRCGEKRSSPGQHSGYITEWAFDCGNHFNKNLYCSSNGAVKSLLLSEQLKKAGQEWNARLRSVLEDQEASSSKYTGNKFLRALAEPAERLPEYDMVTWDNFTTTKRDPPPLFTGTDISCTAVSTCDTILIGFERTTTEDILIHGDIEIKHFNNSENAKKIQKDLKKNKKLWASEKKSDIFERFKKVEDLLSAIKDKDIEKITKIYYRTQHQHTLSNDPRSEVPIYIHREKLNPNWFPHIENAIKCINLAAPGLYLFETDQRNEFKIEIDHSDDPTQAWTCKTSIHLGKKWPVEQMNGTSIHELLHALGFEHEMQRRDADLYVDINLEKDYCYADQYYADNYLALTRFDPFSVLMYPEDKHMKRKQGDSIWEMKSGKEQEQELSELNKVALNLLFKPCISAVYSPQISQVTGMLYCKRNVMDTHNQNAPGTTDGFCGPNNWANCPACRVIKDYINEKDNSVEIVSKIQTCINRGLWQGLTGLFYCGKRYTDDFYTFRKGVKIHSDGVCGFDNGIPCNECGNELCPNYDWQMWLPKPVVTGQNNTRVCTCS